MSAGIWGTFGKSLVWPPYGYEVLRIITFISPPRSEISWNLGSRGFGRESFSNRRERTELATQQAPNPGPQAALDRGTELPLGRFWQNALFRLYFSTRPGSLRAWARVCMVAPALHW